MGNHIQLFAQIPVNDPGWILKPTLSEGFNSAGLDSNKWWIKTDPDNSHFTLDYSRNVTFTGTTIKIKVDTLYPAVLVDTTYYHYQGGAIGTVWWDYQYGYLEIRAKYPTGEYVWPAFWVWGDECFPDNLDSSYYNEIDIAEQGGPYAFEGHTMLTNWHVLDNIPTRCDSLYDGYNTNDPLPINNLPRLDSIFHKYAIEWNPERMTWYFDDVPVRTVYDPAKTPKHKMDAIIGVGVDLYNKPHENKLDPVFLEVDYMNYYKLNTDCNTNLTICTPGTDYSSRAVEKIITTGGTGCSSTFNTSDGYTLRATDYVILDAGTTINPNGSGQFSIQIMQCPE